MSIAAGGTNGHTPVLSLDYANADFVENVTDLVGSMVASAVDGLDFDDALNALSSSLGNLIFADGLNQTGTTSVSVLPDPASALTVTVSPAGVSVAQTVSADAGNLATIGTDSRVMVDPASVSSLATDSICDAFGVELTKSFPA